MGTERRTLPVSLNVVLAPNQSEGWRPPTLRRSRRLTCIAPLHEGVHSAPRDCPGGSKTAQNTECHFTMSKRSHCTPFAWNNISSGRPISLVRMGNR